MVQVNCPDCYWYIDDWVKPRIFIKKNHNKWYERNNSW